MKKGKCKSFSYQLLISHALFLFDFSTSVSHIVAYSMPNHVSPNYKIYTGYSLQPSWWPNMLFGSDTVQYCMYSTSVSDLSILTKSLLLCGQIFLPCKEKIQLLCERLAVINRSWLLNPTSLYLNCTVLFSVVQYCTVLYMQIKWLTLMVLDSMIRVHIWLQKSILYTVCS